MPRAGSSIPLAGKTSLQRKPIGLAGKQPVIQPSHERHRACGPGLNSPAIRPNASIPIDTGATTMNDVQQARVPIEYPAGEAGNPVGPPGELTEMTWKHR